MTVQCCRSQQTNAAAVAVNQSDRRVGTPALSPQLCEALAV